MTPVPEGLRELAEKADFLAQGWVIAEWLERHCNIDEDASRFIAAASPDVVLALLDENARLREAHSEMRNALFAIAYASPTDPTEDELRSLALAALSTDRNE